MERRCHTTKGYTGHVRARILAHETIQSNQILTSYLQKDTFLASIERKEWYEITATLGHVSHEQMRAEDLRWFRAVALWPLG